MNIYYDPEKFGLSIVGEVEFSPWQYEFDTLVVFKNEAGQYFTTRDSGCSCPTPFDKIGLADLNGPLTGHELMTELQNAVNPIEDDNRRSYSRDEQTALNASVYQIGERVMNQSTS